MRLRKAEREALALVLDAEHEDVDAAASAVFDTAAGLLLDRDWWLIVVVAPDSLMVYGPYGTRQAALRTVPVLEYRTQDVRVFLRKLAVVEADLDDDGEGMLDA